MYDSRNIGPGQATWYLASYPATFSPVPPLLDSKRHLPQAPGVAQELLQRRVQQREGEGPIAPLHGRPAVTSSFRHVRPHLCILFCFVSFPRRFRARCWRVSIDVGKITPHKEKDNTTTPLRRTAHENKQKTDHAVAKIVRWCYRLSQEPSTNPPRRKPHAVTLVFTARS